MDFEAEYEFLTRTERDDEITVLREIIDILFQKLKSQQLEIDNLYEKR